MFIVPTDYESLVAKGVDHMILERDEEGFFEKVITVHPITKKTQTIKISEKHIIYEIGLDIIPNSYKYKIYRYLQVPLHFLRIVIICGKLLKEEQVDLIRATDPYWMGFFALLLSRINRLPFCVSIHSDYDKRFELDGKMGAPTILGSRKIAKKLERFVLSRANLVMPIRDSLGKRAINDGAKNEVVKVIPHGIDFKPFFEETSYDIYKLIGIEKNKKILSFVGRLSNENYVDDILELARQLSLIREDFILILAGGGNEEDRLRRVINDAPRLKKTVRVLGFQPKEVCFDLRRVSEINLCLMAGFSLIEACAAGRPVISYDVEWHYELVRNGETGFLIKEHDIKQLLNAVVFLLDYPDEAAKLGENAKKLAMEKHDIKKTTEIKKSCYKELLNRNRNLREAKNEGKR